MRYLIVRIGRTLAVAAVLAMLAGGSLARIAPATVDHTALAAGCQGGTSQSCTGLDPTAEGCTALNPDPVPDVRTPHGYTIELRFAVNCQAAWARILNAPSGTPFSVQSITGQGHENFNVPPGFNNGFTNMVDDQARIRPRPARTASALKPSDRLTPPRVASMLQHGGRSHALSTAYVEAQQVLCL